MSYRFRDTIIALVALCLLSPVMLIIMVLLWVTQRRVFFLQKRPGKAGKPFTLLKFSTLYPAPPGEDEYANLRARLTPIGKFLRKSSLDELPQLINVLKGEMALVGPRPLLMEYLSLYTPEEAVRHQVLPGITGWAQVNGRNIISFKQKFQYDLWYIQHRSHWLDFKIMLMTLGKVFLRSGVYPVDDTKMQRYDGSN